MRVAEMFLKPRGLEYIDLDSIIPERPDNAPFLEALKAVQIYDLSPADNALLVKLREKIAEQCGQLYGHKLHPIRDIAITPGSRTTAMLVCLALVNPGDAVAVPDPGLAMYRMAVAMSGATALTYTLLEKNDYLPNVAALMEPPPKKLKLIFLNYPHNPTGAEAEAYFYRDLIKALRFDNVLLVLDSPYSGTSEPAIDLPLQTRKASHLFLELHSFAFPFGVEGMGFASGNRDAIANLDQIIHLSGFRPSRAQVSYILTALEHHRELSGYYIQTMAERRRLLADGLKEIGWKVRAGRLVPFIWARIPAWATSAGFARKLFVSTGVWARPGTDFGENGEGYLRLSLTAPKGKLAKALENIRAKPSMLRKKGG